MEESVPAEPLFGAGEMPPHLRRVNWGAFLLAPFWSLGYGTWSWFMVFVALIVLNVAVGILFPRSADTSIPSALLRQTALQVIGLTFATMFAFKANALVWRKEERRFAAQSEQSVPRPLNPIAAYERSQRTWLIAGVVVFIYLQVNYFLPPAARTSRNVLILGAGLGVQLAAIGIVFAIDRVRNRLARS